MTEERPSGQDQSLAIFRQGGAVGELMMGLRWERTPLGPVAQWPQSLRTSVSVCLASRFPILLWWGPELVMIYNDAYRPILGASKHPQAMGAAGAEIWPEIWHVIGPMLQGVLAGEGATWSEDQLLLLDRNSYLEECYFTFSYSPILDETGGVGGVFCAVTETTEKVIGERRMRTLGDLAADLVDVTTAAQVGERTAKVLSRNQADLVFAEVYLLDDGQLVPLGRSGPAALGAVLGPRDEAVIRNVADRGVPQVLALDASPLTGTQGTQRVLAVPVHEPGRQPPCGVLVAGLTDRRPLDAAYRSFIELIAGHVGTALGGAWAWEAERRRAEALTEIDAAKTLFFSNVSHELRTPLTLIATPVEEALADEEEPLPDRQRERLELVRRNARRLHRLVNTLLDFARIEGGRLTPVKSAVDLAQLTTDLVGTFAPVFAQAGVDLSIQCPPLPRPVHVDREMWERIVLNIVSNAFKFTLQGGVEVSLVDRSAEVELSVVDTGVGIPAMELPRVFDRFHRVERVAGRSQEGSGIGLALVESLVNLHGGKIRISSKEGLGTTVTVTIPYGEGVPTEALPPAGSSQTQAFVDEALGWVRATPPISLARARSAARPGRILVVDDNADLRGYVSGLLAPHWDVEVAADGLSALELIRRDPPALVLADVMMPGLDGFGLLRRIRRDSATAQVPVVFLSARAGEEAAIEGLAAGADDYLVKPFSSAELLARVRAALERAQIRMLDSRWRRAILHSLGEGVFLAGADGTIFEVNEAWADIVGYGQAGTPYRPPYPWWPAADERPEELALANAAHLQLFAKASGTFEVPFRHRDGHPVWVALSTTRVEGDHEADVLFVGTIRDVTREHRTAERGSALTALLTDLAAAVDTDGVLSAVAEHVGELFDGVAVATAWDDRRSEVAARTKGGRQRVGRLPTGLRAGLDRLRQAEIDQASMIGAVAGTGAPLRTSGDIHAAFWVEFPRPRAMSAEERLLVPVVADSIGHALARARRSDVQELVSDRLQRSMLGPEELPSGFAARYLPLDDRFRIGGDWYDAVPLGENVVGLIVGDCVGRGLEAATAMGHLRDAARALLLSTAHPAATLEALDRFAESVPGAECTTAVCAVVDTGSGEVTYCNAGHVRPLLRNGSGVTELEDGTGLPLGVFPGGRREEVTMRLAPGDTLVIFSDGLVERRGEDVTDGMERAAQALAATAETTPAGIVDALLQAEAPVERREDDVVVVAYRQP